jgi:hypothetical protein
VLSSRARIRDGERRRRGPRHRDRLRESADLQALAQASSPPALRCPNPRSHSIQRPPTASGRRSPRGSTTAHWRAAASRPRCSKVARQRPSTFLPTTGPRVATASRAGSRAVDPRLTHSCTGSSDLLTGRPATSLGRPTDAPPSAAHGSQRRMITGSAGQPTTREPASRQRTLARHRRVGSRVAGALRHGEGAPRSPSVMATSGARHAPWAACCARTSAGCSCTTSAASAPATRRICRPTQGSAAGKAEAPRTLLSPRPRPPVSARSKLRRAITAIGPRSNTRACTGHIRRASCDLVSSSASRRGRTTGCARRARSARTGPVLGAGVRTRAVGAGRGVGRAPGGRLWVVREPCS